MLITVAENNELYTVGSNEFGQLGVEQSVERRVERVRVVSGSITHIACGDTFTAVANAGVWCKLVQCGKSSKKKSKLKMMQTVDFSRVEY